MSGRAYGLRECAIPSCASRIGQQYLMCPTHWAKVPGPLRGRLLKVFGEYRSLPDDADRHTVLEIGTKLRAAQADAVRVVVESEKGGAR